MQSKKQVRKKIGCDEYVEDQLNVASKNLAKYLFDEKLVKNIWIFVP